jgi:hypothetical protein
MGFAKFMASWTGRGLRIAIGLALITYGIMSGGTLGYILAVVGLLALATGAFNVCVIAPLLGAPFSGAAVHDAALPVVATPTALATEPTPPAPPAVPPTPVEPTEPTPPATPTV